MSHGLSPQAVQPSVCSSCGDLGRTDEHGGGLSREWLVSAPPPPDNRESQAMGGRGDVMGRFPFSLTQALCTRCTETTSREPRRIPGRSRSPTGPSRLDLVSQSGYAPNKGV